MEYFSPKRPLVAGRPCYVDLALRAIAPLPSVDLVPLPDGSWQASLMLQFREKGQKQYYAWRHIHGAFAEIEAFLCAYRHCPEEALAYWLDYTLVPEEPTKNISLEDLDL